MSKEAKPSMDENAQEHATGNTVHERPKGWDGIDVALICLLLAFGALSRAPFGTPVLKGYDPIQCGLALTQYDLAIHRPHPPGAPVFIAVAKLSSLVANSATAALVTQSVLFGVLSIVAVYFLGRAVHGRCMGFAAAVLYAVSPMAWLWSETGGSAGLDTFLACMFCLFCWKARKGCPGAAVLSSVAISLLIGCRQNVNLASVSLIPLWLWGMSRSGWKGWLGGIVAFVGTTAAWGWGMLAACGGTTEYVDALLPHLRRMFYESSPLAAAVQGNVRLAASRTIALPQAICVDWLQIFLLAPALLNALRLVRLRKVLTNDRAKFVLIAVTGMILGVLALPYHPEEYLAVCFPVLAIASTAGTFLAADLVCRVLFAAVRERAPVRQTPLFSSILLAAYIVVGINGCLYAFLCWRILPSLPDEVKMEEPGWPEELLKLDAVRKRFPAESTVLVGDWLPQRYACMYAPKYRCYYLPSVFADPKLTLIDRAGGDGTERRLVGEDLKKLPLPPGCRAVVFLDSAYAGCIRANDPAVLHPEDAAVGSLTWVELPTGDFTISAKRLALSIDRVREE